VIAMGQVLGTINVLDAAGRYGDSDVAVVRGVTPFLVGPFLRELQA
jgi:hypothetical protein